MEIILKIVLAVLGIALYTAVKARAYIFSNKNTFDGELLLQDNLRSWVWALILLSLIASIISLEPGAADALKSLTGLDLQNTTLGFLSLGFGLAAFTKNVKKG